MLLKFWPQNFKGKEDLINSGNLQGRSYVHNLKRREIRFFHTQQGVFGINTSGKNFVQLFLSAFPEYSDP